MSKNNTNTLPIFSLNVPGGGPQQPVSMTNTTPVYSSYTGNLIGYGPMNYGVKTDAPVGHPNYGTNYHVIEYNPANKSYMAHDPHIGKK